MSLVTVMPPTRLPRNARGALDPLFRYSRRSYSSICLRCRPSTSLNSHSPRRRNPESKQLHLVGARRHVSNVSDAVMEPPPIPLTSFDNKSELKAALLDLQKNSGNYVNISRLQLALRGLEQTTGEETIRVAVLGLADQQQMSKKIRDLVRLLLADPLKEEEEWERILIAAQDTSTPLLLRIGENIQEETITYGLSNKLVQELNVSSPGLNNYRLEILVLESDIFADSEGQGDTGGLILVPTVDIPTSNSGRYTPVTTPVHRALVLGDGILGATSLIKLSGELDSRIILSAVDLPAYPTGDKNLPLQCTDISLATAGLNSFRKSVENAMTYERDWFKSGLPEILMWLKNGSLDDPNRQEIKNALRILIDSVLVNANMKIREEELRQISAALASKVSPSDLDFLKQSLENWAEKAHTELRDQLEIAFRGSRWRKLGWWKLFWRVDDVSMIASDILNQRYLTDAEKEVIYLAGNVDRTFISKLFPTTFAKSSAYESIPGQTSYAKLGSTPGPIYMDDLLDTPEDDPEIAVKQQPWPLHIPLSRKYLSLETIPALQALAQKLVLQTFTTSGFTSVFAGLLYVSTTTTTLYETGAIAALGLVWSLRRMQTKWETARTFWEGEVWEEGRKAVRATEGQVTRVLSKEGDDAVEGQDELQRAKEGVKRAEEALSRVCTGTEKDERAL